MSLSAPASWYDCSDAYDDSDDATDPETASLEATQPNGEIITLEDWEEREALFFLAGQLGRPL